MNTELIELARRAVACDGWRWMEGISVGTFGTRGGKSHFSRIHRIRKDGLVWCLSERHGFVPLSHVGGNEPLPDLTDPATLGCLLALVREVLNEPEFLPGVVHGDGDPYYFAGITDAYSPTSNKVNGPKYPDLAHALVAALEAGSR